LEARELAKSARERGDEKAERNHYLKALMHQATERLRNKEMAELIFDERNKVRGDSVEMWGRACS